MNKPLIASLLLTASACAMAKLPPLSEEAQAKAEEAKAKAAHNAKVDAYDLCKSQDKVAAHVQRTNKAKAGKPVATAAWADPGKFEYNPNPPTAAAPAAPTVSAGAKKS